MDKKIFTSLIKAIKSHIKYESDHLFKKYEFPKQYEDLTKYTEILAKTEEEKHRFCMDFLNQMIEEEQILKSYLGTRPKINPTVNSNGE